MMLSSCSVQVVRFPEAIEASVEELMPNRITDYLYDLSEKFNGFYTECKVQAALTEVCIVPLRLMALVKMMPHFCYNSGQQVCMPQPVWRCHRTFHDIPSWPAEPV